MLSLSLSCTDRHLLQTGKVDRPNVGPRALPKVKQWRSDIFSEKNIQTEPLDKILTCSLPAGFVLGFLVCPVAAELCIVRIRRKIQSSARVTCEG